MALSLIRVNSQKLLRTEFLRKCIQTAQLSDHERNMIGKREIVGFGHQGQPHYVDRPEVPFPAIRWKEPTCELEALREKEKGDWNELTCEEKKALYRASFCQTYAEFGQTNVGEWKLIIAHTIMLCVPAFWIFFYFKVTIYKCMGVPDTFSDEKRECQFRRILDLKMNPVEGIASKWDYDRDCWK